MTDVTTLLRTAIADEPPMGLSQDDVIRRGRAAQRRSRVMVGAAASVGVLGVAATVANVAASAPHHHAGTTTLAQLTAAADRHPLAVVRPAGKAGAHVGGITAATLSGLVERSIGVDLVNAQVSVLPPARDIDLAAGIGVAGHPYLNVQVVPPGNISLASESCADLSDLSSPDSDGYAGPCTLTHLSDGAVLIVRSGKTTTGGYTKVQADLILADGTGILAENTNQAADFLSSRAPLKSPAQAKALAPVITDLPPLSSAVMSQLVQDLAAAES